MERLHPKVLILFFAKNIVATIYVVPIWFIAVAVFERIWPKETGFLPFEQIIYLLYGSGIIFMIGIFVGCYYWAWFTYSSYSYAVQSDGLHIYKGVLLKRQMIIPSHEIQNISLYINPVVMRLLGLYSLQIQTKQLENTQGVIKKPKSEIIPGLTPEAAQYLRNELIKLSHIQAGKKTFFDPVSGRYR
jgi:membrane protein YdbS with pleckstrin-like domain